MGGLRGVGRVVREPGLFVLCLPFLLLVPWPILVTISLIGLLDRSPSILHAVFAFGLVYGALATIVRPLTAVGIARLCQEDGPSEYRGGLLAGPSTLRRTLATNDSSLATAEGVRFGVVLLVALPVWGVAALLLVLVTGSVSGTEPAALAWVLGGLPVVALYGTLTVTGFADLCTIAGESPRSAWRTSASLVARRPLRFLAHLVVRSLFLGVPAVAAWMVTYGPPAGITLGGGGVLLALYGTGLVATAILAASRVASFDALTGG